MRAPKTESVPATSADEGFQAALGVAQNTKNLDILAVHNEGQVLIAYERSKMSNQKVFLVGVNTESAQPAINIVVGTDPGTRPALLDGRANGKSLDKFVTALKGALDGSAPVTTTPVDNHYMQKKDKVAWTDATQEPDIQVGFNWLEKAARWY